MKRDTLNAIKFRGITSGVLAICTYLIIWVCCEFWHDVEISKFLCVAAVIVAMIFASMIFKLSATKIISDISDSKVFRTYLITFSSALDYHGYRIFIVCYKYRELGNSQLLLS